MNPFQRPALPARTLRRRAVVLWAALLLSLLAVAPLLAGSDWFGLIAAVTALVALVGMAARSVRRLRPVVPLVQALAATVPVLVLAARLPAARTAEVTAVEALPSAIVGGAESLLLSVAPAAVGLESKIVLVVLLSLLHIILELVLLDLNLHTPVALALMCAPLLSSVVHPAGTPWWSWAAPVGAGLALLALRGLAPDPVRAAGDVGPLPGPAPRPGLLAASSGLIVAVSLVAGLQLGPALPQPDIARHPLRTGLFDALGESGYRGAVQVDETVSVRGQLLSRESRPVLAYRTDAEDPGYLRTAVLDAYDDAEWSVAPGAEDAGRPVAGLAPIEATRPAFPEDRLYELGLGAVGGDAVPVPEGVTTLATEPATEGLVLTEDDTVRATGQGSPDGLVVRALADQEPVDRDALRALDAPDRTERAVEIDVPERLVELSDQVVADAGAETDVDRALAIQDFFRDNFFYSLDVPIDPEGDPVEQFLEIGGGYCEQFAATAALMMIAQGLDARVVVGYTGGSAAGDDTFTVTTDNAHAWPEVNFGPDGGWVRFEPTPGEVGSGIEPPAEAAVSPSAVPSDVAPAPAPAPTASERPDTDPGAVGTPGAAAEAAEARAQALGTWLGIAGALAAAVAFVGIARGPARERRARRAAALAAGATLDAAWDEIAATAAEAEVPLDPALPESAAIPDLVERLRARGVRIVPEVERAGEDLVARVREARYAPDADTALDRKSVADAELLLGVLDPVRDQVLARRRWE